MASFDADLVTSLKALSDPLRLRILGRLAERPASADELATGLELPLAAVVRALGRLRVAGLVAAATASPGRAGAFRLRLDALQALGRRLDEIEHGPDRAGGLDGAGGLDANESLATDDARVLRGYLEDGRLTTIPAHEKKRLVVLRWLRDRVFTEDRDYPEKELNQRLALYHPDVASLRRHMVDAGLATRAAGLYRRADAG